MRLYDEKEIGAILKRTAELSKHSDLDNVDGLSLDEIKHLATEAGLDPNLVVRAASELSVGKSPVVERDIFGGPLSHSMELDLSVDVDQDTWESMLPAIRSYFKDPGIVQTRDGAFEWTGSGGEFSRKAHVSVKRTNGGSKLHLFWNERTSAVPFFIPTIMAAVISLPILFEELAMGLEAIPIWIAIVGTFFFLSRFGVSSMKNRHVQKLDRLGNELTQIALQSGISKQSVQLSQGFSEPISGERIDSDHAVAFTEQESKGERSKPSIELPDDEFENQDPTGSTTSERDIS